MSPVFVSLPKRILQDLSSATPVNNNIDDDLSSVATVLSGNSDSSFYLNNIHTNNQSNHHNLLYEHMINRQRMWDHFQGKLEAAPFSPHHSRLFRILRQREEWVQEEAKQRQEECPDVTNVTEEESVREDSHATGKPDGSGAVVDIHLHTKNHNFDEPQLVDEIEQWHDAVQEINGPFQGQEALSKPSPPKISDTILLEWYLTVPAALSLALHCLAHSTIYDTLEIMVEQLKKMELYTASVAVFILGVCMMRFSGYLYWFLNDVDYWAMKLELHNRLEMGYWDARLMVFVKRRPMVQAILYFVGYHLCYKIVFDVYENVYYSFFREEETAQMTSLWNGTYGWSVEGMQAYWEDFLERVGNTDESIDPVCKGPIQAALFCGIICVISVSALRSYGFGFFEKY